MMARLQARRFMLDGRLVDFRIGPGSGATLSAEAGQSTPKAPVQHAHPSPETFAKSSYTKLQGKVSDRRELSKKSATELETALATVRKTYQHQLMLLKDLELERIDLKADAQWLASTRANWRSQQQMSGTEINAELDRRLEDEEKAAFEEIRRSDSLITQVSEQASRLRSARERLEEQLADMRYHFFTDTGLLAHCQRTLEILDPTTHRLSSGLASPRSRSTGLSSLARRSVAESVLQTVRSVR